jgi:hypothetical protein
VHDELTDEFTASMAPARAGEEYHRATARTGPVRRIPGLARPRNTMYTYIMERTQIYLTAFEVEALDREVARTGRTRSRLIRDAIDTTYLGAPDRDRLLQAINESAGAWKDRDEDGMAYVERVRGPGLGYRLSAMEREAEGRAGPERAPSTQPGPDRIGSPLGRPGRTKNRAPAGR